MNSNEKYTLEIVYNGEKITLDEEQAVKLAQKGMNYDRLLKKYSEVAEKLDSMAGYKEKIDNLAAETGTTPEKIMELLEDNAKEFRIANFAQTEQVPHEYAEKMMSMKKEIETLKKEKEELMPIIKREEDISDFTREYPGVSVSELDEDVVSEWKNSKKPLVDVYNSVMLKKLMSKKEAEDANEKNKRASSGSVRDAFTSERIYSEDEIRKMSDEDIKKKFKMLARQLSKKGDE